MNKRALKVNPDDNVAVALEDLRFGERILVAGEEIVLAGDIPQKHKFTTESVENGGLVTMYGVTVGQAMSDIPRGGVVSTANLTHHTDTYVKSNAQYSWHAPDTSGFADSTWSGYHRDNGKVGTRNYWLVVPLVFCENRNVGVIKASLAEQLGYITENDFSIDTRAMVESYRNGASPEEIMDMDVLRSTEQAKQQRVFKNVDGIKFLSHDGGCGGTKDDIQALCNLIAGYITHPNVGGATVLSLGCQMAQVKMLEKAIEKMCPEYDRPLLIFDQQEVASERQMIAQAVKATFTGIMQIDQVRRSSASPASLNLGLECGGSDGFSGISANPVLGYTSDLLVALGGVAILSEFPELNGVEQELINRCVRPEDADKFIHLMNAYSGIAQKHGADFSMNPSPGNIKDGLITDAMKSAGAAKKGGTSPIVGVLDYTEQIARNGLHLLCTPGTDVESTTGLAGSGANLIAFTTGLGTPTGNPVAPTLKISSNTRLANRMSDIIDFDTGPVVTGEQTIEEMGSDLLKLMIEVANGEILTRAELLGQDDFIPWKRGISL